MYKRKEVISFKEYNIKFTLLNLNKLINKYKYKYKSKRNILKLNFRIELQLKSEKSSDIYSFNFQVKKGKQDYRFIYYPFIYFIIKNLRYHIYS